LFFKFTSKGYQEKKSSFFTLKLYNRNNFWQQFCGRKTNDITKFDEFFVRNKFVLQNHFNQKRIPKEKNRELSLEDLNLKMFAHGRPGIFFFLFIMLASRSKTRNKSHNILQAFRAYLQNKYSSKKKSWKICGKISWKNRWWASWFFKTQYITFFDKICTNHICTSNSPQKNIKTEDNHENALQN